MAEAYKAEVGTRRDCTQVDREAVEVQLNRGKFNVSTNKGTYSREECTISYIGSIFDALQKLEDLWTECASKARAYIQNFEDIDEPESFPDDTAYLDVQEYTSPITGKVATKSSALNVRSKPSIKGSIKTTFEKDSQVTILGEYVDSDGKKWYQVKLNDDSLGYVSGDYITTNGQNGEFVTNISQPNEITIPETIFERGEATVTLQDPNSHLNVRLSANTSSSDNIIGKLNHGDKVEIVGKSEDANWVIIKYNGEKRFVSAKYLK